MEEVGTLFLVWALDGDFNVNVNDIVRCFVRSNLTSIAGDFEQAVPRYLPYDFKHDFRMTQKAFGIF